MELFTIHITYTLKFSSSVTLTTFQVLIAKALNYFSSSHKFPLRGTDLEPYVGKDFEAVSWWQKDNHGPLEMPQMGAGKTRGSIVQVLTIPKITTPTVS